MLVSIIVRTKDRPTLLREALESLAAQTHRPLEVVVVNDGGQDVEEIVSSYTSSFDHLQYLVHEKNRGRAAAANTGLAAAKGEFVGLLDDDDLLLPEAIKTLLWYTRVAGAAYGKVEIIKKGPDKEETLGLFEMPFSREALFINNYIPTCGFIFRRELALKIGGFDEEFALLEDWDFIFRLALETDFVFAPQKVAIYRLFGRGFVLGNTLKEFPWREKFYAKHFQKLPPRFLAKAYYDFASWQQEKISSLHQQLLEEQEKKDFLEAKVVELEAALEAERSKRAELEAALEAERSKRAELEAALEAEREKSAELERALEAERSKRAELEATLAALLSSESWRITAPLRWLGSRARALKGRAEKLFFLFQKFQAYRRAFGLQQALKKSYLYLRGYRGARIALPAPEPRRLSFEEAREILEGLSYKPLISILVPVYNPPAEFLRSCLESVFRQYYPHWELCIADDASTKPYVREILEEFRARAPEKVKIFYRPENGHISEATNSALKLAEGEFIALLDHDDELAPEALLEVVCLLNEYPEADMIYSDEDKISPSGEYLEPYYKPDWAPEFFLGQMYTCHLGVYRRRLAEEIGGFRKGFEGAQDWDFVLRFTERTSKIFHLPRCLYHWRIHQSSTAASISSKDYAIQAGKKAVEEALRRRGLKGYPEEVAPGFLRLHLKPSKNPLVSIIIPTKDLAADLEKCLSSIVSKTTYQNYEFLIIDNGSQEEETFALFDRWHFRLGERFRVERFEIPFNFSRLVNFGAEKARGEVFLLLNNDTELISPPNWLEEMLGFALQKEIGAVGAVLLYPDNTIQHAGVILGIAIEENPNPHTLRVAEHAFKHLPADHPGYFGRLLVVSNYAAVTGACLMVERKKFEKVGGFDETLQVAFNDIDFCLKLLQEGFRQVVLPQVRLYHYESKSRGYEDTPEKQARFLREIKIMRQRWANLLDNDPYYNPNLPRHRQDFGIL